MKEYKSNVPVWVLIAFTGIIKILKVCGRSLFKYKLAAICICLEYVYKHLLDLYDPKGISSRWSM
jgi:hypothetical protein